MGAGDAVSPSDREAPPPSLKGEASSRKLSTSTQRAPSLKKIPSSILQRNPSQSLRKLIPPSSPASRPSTAASTHSRIHAALRHSDSSFLFSSKAATVDGFLYSSRFQQDSSLLPTAAQPRARPTTAAALSKHARKRETQTSPKQSTALQHSQSERSLSKQSVPTSDGEETDATKHKVKSSKLRPLSSPFTRPHHDTKETDTAAAATTVSTQVKVDDAGFLQRKRRCASTFEEMILARIQGVPRDPDSSEAAASGIDTLLSDGIIQSVLSLSALNDAATQAHCCRALYYLAQARSARKPMVAQGVTMALKSLARTAPVKSRQDIASTLCHLSEEHGLVESMLFEGLDRCLVRLFATSELETRRICALTVFNISSDAVKIKHSVESFSQLLITATKSSYGHATAASYLLKAVYNVARLPAFHASLLGDNIPRFLASQLPSVPDEIKVLALQATVSLCEIKANRPQLLSQTFCHLLEKLLQSKHRDVQEMALLVLLLLSLDEGSRIKLCNWLPAATIVQAAESHLAAPTSSALYLDSCILRNLCDSVLTHHELVEEGVVPLLLQMSRRDDHDIKSNAVCALVSIIASSPEESAEYVVEILDELLTLTRSPTHHICYFAVGAVYNIACNDDCLSLLLQSSDLLERLRQLAMEPPHANIADLTAAIIYRLTTLDEDGVTPATAKPLLLQRGFFSALVQLIRGFPSARTYAVHALHLLAQTGADTQSSATVSFPHGTEEIAVLVNALSTSTSGSDPVTAAAAAKEDALTAARSAVTLIAQLARHRVNHPILVRNGAVFTYLRSLRRVMHPTGDFHDETLAMNSAYIFYALTATQDGCEQLIAGLGIEELIHLARTTKLQDSSLTLRVRELFVMTMCRLSSFLGLEGKLIEHGAIDAVLVLALVSSTDSVTIKTLCIKTLANCLVAKHCARPLIEHGVIWALCSLASVDAADTRLACAVSLCNLATVPHMLPRFLDAGAPRALLHLLQKCSDDHGAATTAIIVIKAIANLVASEKICMALMNDDIERHLSVYFANPRSSDEMRQLAAMILLRVTSANDAVISVEHLKHGVFVWMEQIIAMEDDALVKNCMLTVHDLTCSSTVDAAEMDVDHVLRIVIQVVHRHARNGDVLTLCLWVLYNLSCQLSVVDRLVRDEILVFIRHQIPQVTLPFPIPGRVTSTQPPHTASSPAPTLAAMPIHATSSMLLLNGAIAQSIVPATSQSLDAKLCCLTLHNLSCSRDASGTLLAALANAHAVAMLTDIYLQRDDLKETCAVAVCNLAIGKVNSTKVVEDRGGDLLIHFVASPLFHRCHYRLVSIAMRRLVNAPGNQPTLLARGIGRAVVRVLELVDPSDVETTRNLIASLSLLSKSKTHLLRLLQDGALPIVIAVSERKSSSATGMNAEILGYCFEILSDLCTVNFEAYARNNNTDGEPINVITTLTRLSELHQSFSSPTAGRSSAGSYYERGDQAHASLAFPQLLTFMKKAPAANSSVKKNLELQATFQVPSRKWLPDSQAVPHDPPALECNEIPLTEGSQSIPHDIKDRIRNLTMLHKEKLVRDETCTITEVETPATVSETGEMTLGTVQEQPEETTSLPSGMPAMLGSRNSTTKKLQRGLAGRNLSLASAMASANPLLL